MKLCPYCAERIQDAAIVCRFCGRELGTPPGVESGGALALVLRGSEIALGVGAVALVGYLLAAQAGALPLHEVIRSALGASVAEAPSPPFVLSLLEGREVHILAGDHFDTTFVVSDPRPCTFTGEVRGLAGGDRDVEVYLLDEMGFDQWHSNLEPTAVYESGRSASALLDVPLPAPGRYTLLLSNRYSLWTDKRVRVDGARVTCR